MDLSAILLFAAALAVAIATSGPTVAVLVARVLTLGGRATSELRSA
jgi:threonine/homoserine/homoserine lactone efflux protein